MSAGDPSAARQAHFIKPAGGRCLLTRVCSDCSRLWQEHAEATRAYLKISSNLQIARIRQDSSALAALEPEYDQAAERRDTARSAFKTHREEHKKARATPAKGSPLKSH
jgi:hypothetical protein